jgi:hypothetical protein
MSSRTKRKPRHFSRFNSQKACYTPKMKNAAKKKAKPAKKKGGKTSGTGPRKK